MGEIQFDFGAAGCAAHRIEETANCMYTEVLCDFEEIAQELFHYWKGTAGEQFQRKMRREAEQMRQTAELLEHAGGSVQEAILKARHVEEKSKEIAELRIY